MSQIVLLAALTGLSSAVAGQGNSAVALSAGDRKAVAHALEIIRLCQLDDGMIRMSSGSDQVWVMPYFSNFAAMGLLAGNHIEPNPEDVVRVERWLCWYARNQEADGTIYDREGSVSSYRSSGKRDSTDSYAATFLMTVWRYSQATGNRVPPDVARAAGKALSAIEAVTQPDGLTIAKPDYAIKYWMDNVEVYQGLAEGALFFDAAGATREAAKARRMASRIARGLEKYWSGKEQCFAYALDMKDKMSIGFSDPYPHGLAQMFALAYCVPADRQLWQKVSAHFKPDKDGLPAERWLPAAIRCGSEEEIAQYRDAVRASLAGFTAGKIYVHRPALAILALIDGEVRFPDVPLKP